MREAPSTLRLVGRRLRPAPLTTRHAPVGWRRHAGQEPHSLQRRGGAVPERRVGGAAAGHGAAQLACGGGRHAERRRAPLPAAAQRDGGGLRQGGAGHGPCCRGAAGPPRGAGSAQRSRGGAGEPSPGRQNEKQEVTRLLATRGAAIGELNAVRRGLSLLKGGGLARLARPAQVVTLILSDVVGDPLEAIASGPTVRNPTTPSHCLDVLGRYELLGRVAPSVLHHLSHPPSPRSDDDDLSHVLNLIVGSSGLALQEACAHAARLGYEPLALSRSVTGDVADAAEFYSRLIAYACRRLRSRGGPTGGGDAEDEVDEVEEAERLKEAAARCGVDDLSTEALAGTVAMAARRRGGRLCVACGGETTVSVGGDGRGGRNQELALHVARRLGGLRQTQPIQSPLGPVAAPSGVGDVGNAVDATRGCSAVFLSAGTDGQDGPTPAAGALAWPSLVAEARAAGADVEEALRRNDSFGFYSALGEGLVVTGLTGTNVMDVQLVLVQPRQP
ncbi:glycerate kinase isoform X2 [Lampetra fluviatilis]